MTKKRIIIIDDEPLIPVLMKEIIEEDQELEVAAVASQKNEFLDFVSQDSFDAALIDISVGGHREGGLEILQILKARGIRLPAIIISAHNEFDYALKCLQYGARGYVCKSHICMDIAKALKEVLQGSLFISGTKGQAILDKYKTALTP